MSVVIQDDRKGFVRSELVCLLLVILLFLLGRVSQPRVEALLLGNLFKISMPDNGRGKGVSYH